MLPAQHVAFLSTRTRIAIGVSLLSCLLFSTAAEAGTREQAARMHDRLAGVPATDTVLDTMSDLIANDQSAQAAMLAMDNPAFYNVTLKHWVTPWTNEAFDAFAPLNDYTATVIGMVRDDVDFRLLLSGDIIYTADGLSGIPGYSNTSNAHYQALDDQMIDLQASLVPHTQSSVTGLPAQATAGVLTTRAAAKAFFKDGTNRAMFRFTLINHMCTDLEGVADITRPPDRVRQDVSRSPGGDSRLFHNSCVGCHSGMDPMTQAFAYYEYDYDADSDPDGEQGQLDYNREGDTDPDTGLRVQAKYWINSNNFVFGYITPDDHWDNYWREGPNQYLGWSNSLSGSGEGAKSLGEELANSEKFADCQVTKVFEEVCLRSPQDAADRSQIDAMAGNFAANGYRLKTVFADAASYCMGD